MVTPEATGQLTAAEMSVIDQTATIWNTMVRDVIGTGRSRAGDISELAGHIHAIQQSVMSNAAARAYPSKLRTLGGTIQETS